MDRRRVKYIMSYGLVAACFFVGGWLAHSGLDDRSPNSCVQLVTADPLLEIIRDRQGAAVLPRGVHDRFQLADAAAKSEDLRAVLIDVIKDQKVGASIRYESTCVLYGGKDPAALVDVSNELLQWMATNVHYGRSEYLLRQRIKNMMFNTVLACDILPVTKLALLQRIFPQKYVDILKAKAFSHLPSKELEPGIVRSFRKKAKEQAALLLKMVRAQ